ncbi:type III pantothenate kinase [Cellvibrio japonicus]|uniref:Type III pantothenate kinase n=1 Tax=Cellvibrio japonicus (strain Ueda107) TaxID=498211 RepID=COAX_CELJU|nr:type III pantothenate kinase [Cellvibrio japonicus]B3PK21.1 RecName: Full=Type III pantothenate kinase; AltName: Full=PanK-III; AltName: Full=Pantothenic acid kinase [Cellvibrio japonicus Ueda107]ACE82684.1 transcriptional activator, putative, Baf family [Cellvibrio japonicus Ueda107]QEI11343.1 type III pantothenate kinase [Cellvibrio japonicus]QEI14917.1 type III pantothenate kinase [Cellvibrio japonicus]QEI18497.1 type III pantothenate kinase [Cellvibrio japonicus]
MILQIDMGNTRLKWRVKNKLASLVEGHCLWSDAEDALMASLMPYGGLISRILVASVRSQEDNQAFMQLLGRLTPLVPEFAYSQSHNDGLVNGYADPERLGVDRWLALLAGYDRHKAYPFMLMSAGTALTLDLVDGQGHHLGGYIAPGLDVFVRAVSHSAAQINVVKSNNLFDASPGRSTVDAVHHAFAAMLSGLVQKSYELLSRNNGFAPVLLITGGDADVVKGLFHQGITCPDLVFSGLDIYFDLRAGNNG